MKICSYINKFPLILAAVMTTTSASAQPTENLSRKEAEAIAADVYVYGYPLVMMDQTRRVMTNVESASEFKAPMGQFANLRTFPKPEFKDVTTPNADTLYSSAWIDLSKEPYILHLPAEKNRYYLMPMLSGWTNVFFSPGTRTTGDKAGDYVITGPGWKGALPKAFKEIKSPTNMVWLIGRTYTSGTPEDYKEVHKIQDEYRLIPLSAVNKSYNPPKGEIDPTLDVKTPVRDQVNSMDGVTFFQRLASLLKDNPPAAADTSIVAKMAQIGIVPGQNFDATKLKPEIAKAIQNAPKIGLEKIKTSFKGLGKGKNGWSIALKTGSYGTDYLVRATVAYYGLGANLPEDAVYPETSVDSKGQHLDGTLNRYTIRFPKGQTPPVKGFWSITVYNDQLFFEPNAIGRYSIGSKNPLKFNSDGSLDIYLQRESPGKDKESNWLPIAKGPFDLVLRAYWPERSIVDGTWQPPPVEKNK